jgi:hypothetical protein
VIAIVTARKSARRMKVAIVPPVDAKNVHAKAGAERAIDSPREG